VTLAVEFVTPVAGFLKTRCGVVRYLMPAGDIDDDAAKIDTQRAI